LAAATGAELRFTLAVPSGASNLRFQISGGTGDADLYVRFGVAPTTTSYDCRPFLSGNAETCTIASAQAGTYHVMLRADAAFSGVSLLGSFSTASSDLAPTVASTQPSQNATGVARESNLTVSFSEAVSLGASWYALGCTSGGSRTAQVSGGPSVYTLDPSSDFLALDNCTLTVNAASVTDQDGTPTPMASNYTLNFQTGAAASGYYASANTSSASALRASLHAIVDDHTRFPYSSSTATDVWDIIERADQDPANSTRVLDIYKNASFAKAGGGNNFYNREHTWPKSLGFPDDVPSNYPYTDSHMLMVSDIGYNSNRGNLPFGDCTASCTEYPTLLTNGAGGGSGVFPGNSNWSNGSIWQVWGKYKGNVARALFYMDVRYEGGSHGVTGVSEPDLRLTDNLSLVTISSGNASLAYMGRLSTLLAWHQQDPVDANERLRNEVVASYQGNRNPFIDNPQWVACVFQSVCN
jgi:endonuclease I